jgi:TolB protein
MKKMIVIVLTAICIVFSTNAERINLEVYASNLDSIPVAMLPFTRQGETPLVKNEPWKVLANDLEFSGKFSLYRAGIKDSVDFVRRNIPLYIDGTYTVHGQSVYVDFALRDVKSSQIILEKKVDGDIKRIRTIAHIFADQLIETLFNGKGIFTNKILFVKDEGARKNISIMDWDGDDARQLTFANTINIFPAFIDSMSYVYTSFIRGHPNIYKGTLNGKIQYLVPGRFIDTSPAYSSVTGKIVFSSSRNGNMDIFTCDIDGSNLNRLTTAASTETSPCWSPNGYQIAFTSDRTGRPQIFIMDADGGNVHRLWFDGPGYQDSPAWSPKGNLVAFHMITNGKFEIWTISPDGKDPFQVTNLAGSNEYAAWAADGDHLVFSNQHGGKSDLYGIRANGTSLKRLTASGNAKMPDWLNY